MRTQGYTNALGAITGWKRLPRIPGDAVLVQADPANTVNVLIALGSGGGAGHELEPGFAFSAELANLDMVYVASADGTTPVRVTYSVTGCGP